MPPGEADMLNTTRNYRAEAQPVFEDMRRLLEASVTMRICGRA
jgi:hypothetical protein